MARPLALARDALTLHEAAVLGEVQATRKLLGAGDLVDAVAADGFTPSHLACYFGQPEVAEILVSHDADVEIAKLLVGKGGHRSQS